MFNITIIVIVNTKKNVTEGFEDQNLDNFVTHSINYQPLFHLTIP